MAFILEPTISVIKVMTVLTYHLVHGQVWEVCSLEGVVLPSLHVCFLYKEIHLSL